jgi:hypothetical protein
VKLRWALATLTFGACDETRPPAPRELVAEVASGLAVGGGFAYYTTDHAVRRVSLEGGDPETIADGQLPTGAIALSERYVYWANGQVQGQARVLRAPLAGGMPEVVASGLHFPGAIAMDATDVYFIESCCSSQALWRIAKAGDARPIKLADIPARTFAFGLAVDRTSVYWTQDAFGAGDGQIMRFAKRDGTIDGVVPAQPGVAAVAVDAWNLYWIVTTANGGPQSAVRRRPLAGGGIVELAADPAEAVAADGRFVWWSSHETTDAGGHARLRRMGNAGSDAATFAQGKQITHIAFDFSRIAWVDVDVPALYVTNR